MHAAAADSSAALGALLLTMRGLGSTWYFKMAVSVFGDCSRPLMVRLSWRRAATIPASVGAKMVMGSEELPNCRREASQAGHVSTSESYGFTAMPPPPPPPPSPSFPTGLWM